MPDQPSPTPLSAESPEITGAALRMSQAIIGQLIDASDGFNDPDSRHPDLRSYRYAWVRSFREIIKQLLADFLNTREAKFITQITAHQRSIANQETIHADLQQQFHEMSDEYFKYKLAHAALQQRCRELEKYKARMDWLHTNTGDDKDVEGFEWGVARIKFNEHGQVVSALWTCSDHSDLDAEMSRAQPPERKHE